MNEDYNGKLITPLKPHVLRLIIPAPFPQSPTKPTLQKQLFQQRQQPQHPQLSRFTIHEVYKLATKTKLLQFLECNTE